MQVSFNTDDVNGWMLLSLLQMFWISHAWLFSTVWFAHRILKFWYHSFSGFFSLTTTLSFFLKISDPNVGATLWHYFILKQVSILFKKGLHGLLIGSYSFSYNLSSVCRVYEKSHSGKVLNCDQSPYHLQLLPDMSFNLYYL